MKLAMNIRIIFTFFFLACSAEVFAQVSEGGKPYSYTSNARLSELQKVEVMPYVDVEALKAEDIENEGKSIPYRFGKTLPVHYNTENSGQWDELPGGDRIWRLTITSKGAYSINLTFGKYKLPEGGKLFVYNSDKSMCIGAFTSKNNQADEQLGLRPVAGDKITLEYFEPAAVKGKGLLEISKVTHAYKPILATEAYGFGNSAACHVNINCPAGDDWQDQKKSVVLILVDGGLCSGAVINNAKEDGRPYVLTADHCYSGSVSTWVYVFNYESPNCTNIEGPTDNTVSGSKLIARNSPSDFLMTELNSVPPVGYNVYYAGWSRAVTAATSATGIHHPAGDIKKISVKNATLTLTSWDSGVNDHWDINPWTSGSTQGGSSGSPLFDQNKRIIGQLHGGTTAVCPGTSKRSIYGAVFASWEGGGTTGTRLKDWLDPDNTGITTLNGGFIQPSACTIPLAASTAVSSKNPVCNGSSFTLTLNGIGFLTGLSYQWQSSLNGTAWTNIDGATSASHTTTQSQMTYYRCVITCNSTPSNSASVQVNSTTDDCVYNMPATGTTNSITTCSGTLYDNGGTGNYGNDLDGTLTIYPPSTGKYVSLTFNSFNTELDYDYLYIYDGINTSATPIGTYNATVGPGTVVATNASGALTLRFTSDESVTRAGFEAVISCIDPLSSNQPLSASKGIKIFPNPSTGLFNLELNDAKSTQVGTIVLYDALGEVRNKKTITLTSGKSTEEIDFSNISPGMYTIYINTGERSYTSKLVITK